MEEARQVGGKRRSARERKKEKERGPQKSRSEAREERSEEERDESEWERERVTGIAGGRGWERTLLTPPSIQDGVGSGSPRH